MQTLFKDLILGILLVGVTLVLVTFGQAAIKSPAGSQQPRDIFKIESPNARDDRLEAGKLWSKN